MADHESQCPDCGCDAHALRADIRAVLAPWHPEGVLGEILAILDREPGREEPACSCFVTPESQWTTHYGATEPGSMREPNPECPAHGHVVEHQPEEPGRPARHVGRSWPPDHHIEDDCPCPNAPCGLVSDDQVSPDCQHHPIGRMETIRQAHPAENCPGSVVEHQPAQDSEDDDALAAIGTRVMDDWAREIEKLTAERDQLRQYAETARHHQQQHAETHRELVNVRARIDTALAQISEWWPTGKNADRTLMAVNSILRGDVVRPASPVAKETGEEADRG